MTRRRWTCLAVAGGACGLALVVLLSEPLRTQRCAVQAVGGPVLACEDRRTWRLPDAEDLAAGAVVGAAVLGGQARPFVRG